MLTHILTYFTFAAIHIFSGVSAAAIGALPDSSTYNLGSGTGVRKRANAPQGPAGDMSLDEVKQLAPQIPEEVLAQGLEATTRWLTEHRTGVAPRDIDADSDDGVEVDTDGDGRVTIEEVDLLISKVPDKVIDQGVDATEKWMNEHRKELVPRDLNSDYNELDTDGDGKVTVEEVDLLISKVPDEVIDQGIDATEKWMNEHRKELAPRDPNTALEKRTTWEVTVCMAYILWFIGTNLTLLKGVSIIAKAIKFKRYVDKVGGPRRAAELLITSGGKHRPMAPGRHRPLPPGKPMKELSGMHAKTPMISPGATGAVMIFLNLAFEIFSLEGIRVNCPKAFD